MPDEIQNVAVDAAGNPIPAAQLPAAIASGELYLPEGGLLAMRDDQGVEQLVAPEQISQAIAKGWAVKSPETARQEALQAEFGGLGGKTLAFTGKAVGSVPIVGQPFANALLGEGGRQRLEKAIEANPITAGVGEAAGILGQVALTAGAGAGAAAARGAQAARTGAGLLRTEEALASGIPTLRAAEQAVAAPWRAVVQLPGEAAARAATAGLRGAGASERVAAVGGRIAQMGTEGATIGASMQLAEDELHATPLQAEKIAHAMAMGALMGGGTELGLAGLGAAARGLGRAGSRLIVREGETLPAALERVADTEQFNAIRATGVEVRKLFPEYGERAPEVLGRKLRTATLEDGSRVAGRAADVTELAPRVNRKIEEVGADLERLKGEVRATNPEVDAQGLLKRFDDLIESRRGGIQTGDSMAATRALEEQIAPFRARVQQATEAGELIPHVASEAERQAAAGTVKALGKFGDVWQQNAQELGQTLADEGYQAFAGKLAKLVKAEGGGLPQGVDVVQLEKTLSVSPKRFGELMGRDFDGFAATVGDELGGVAPLQKFDRLTSPPVSFEDVEGFRQRLSDIVYQQRRAGQGLPTPVALAKDDLRRIERLTADEIARSGEAALTRIGRDPAEWRTANREYHEWRQLRDLVDKRSQEVASHRRTSVSDLAMTAAGGASFGPWGLLMGAGNKVLRERGASMAATAAGAMAEFIRHGDARVHVAARALALGRTARQAAPLAAAAIGTITRPHYSDDDVQQMARSARELEAMAPADRERAVIASLGDFATTNPRQTALAVQAMLRENSYLAAQVPEPRKDPRAELMPAIAEPPLLDRIMAYDFRSKLTALSDPPGVLEDLSHGTVDPVALRTVREAKPEMWADWRQQLLAGLRERTEPIDPREAYMLGSVFDLPLTPDLDPAQVAAAQVANATPEPKQPQGGSGSIDVPAPKTRTERLESS